MKDWIDTLVSYAQDAEACVVVTLARVEGAAPREPGTKMIVSGRGVTGTVGGGRLEARAKQVATEMLAQASPSLRVEDVPTDPDPDTRCAGSARLVFEHFDPPVPGWLEEVRAERDRGEPTLVATWAGDPRSGRPRVISPRAAGCTPGEGLDVPFPPAVRSAARELYENPDAPAGAWVDFDERAGVLLERVAPVGLYVLVFGAGHVGDALVRVLASLPCVVTWVDERGVRSDLPANVRGASDPMEAVARATRGAFYVVMTPSHALDFDVVEAVLRRGDFRYLGMIGSAPKRRQLEKRLEARGLGAEAVARVRCPIGIEGIRGKDPAVIAVAVAAELLLARESS